MGAISTIQTTSIGDIVVPFKTTSATVATDNVFSPEGFNPQGIAQWVDRSGGIPVGYPRVSLQMRRPTKDSRNYRLTLKLSIPTLEVTAPTTVTGIQPAPTKAYDCSAFLECVLPERSTATERTVMFWRLASFFFANIAASDGAPEAGTGTPLYAAIVNLDQPY